MAEYVGIAARVLGRTAHAVRLKLDSDGSVIWVPRTCIEDGGTTVDEALMSGVFMPALTVQITAWKCEQEEWL